MNEQHIHHENEETPLPPRKRSKKKKGLIIIIILLLLGLVAGGTYIYLSHDKENKQPKKAPTSNGDIIRDYKFDENGNPIPVKPPNIGMAIKSAILGDVNGKAEMMIKNSGDIPIEPKVIYKDKTIFQSPLLQPGDAVKAELNFGKLEVGEHEFNVLAMYKGGSGLSLKSKVVVFESGTKIQK